MKGCVQCEVPHWRCHPGVWEMLPGAFGRSLPSELGEAQLLVGLPGIGLSLKALGTASLQLGDPRATQFESLSKPFESHSKAIRKLASEALLRAAPAEAALNGSQLLPKSLHLLGRK